ncbi:MAG TPA: hypothetical protein VFA59_17360 [Vicinamibacterales bacterium]|nr:hypothetical protein [Vicinamibacterales bacterium]
MSTATLADTSLRAIRHRALDVFDRRYDLIHQIRREPVKAIGIVFGAGLLVGAAVSFACSVLGRKAGDVCAPRGGASR